MPKFVNPYNFVRSEYDGRLTKPPLPHDRLHLDQYSGRLTCSLKTLTQVTSKSFEETAIGPDRSLIYGSSLKGLVRSVAEAVSCSCYAVGDEQSRCRRVERLCICCRMFGWMPKGHDDVHLGRVQIGDARPHDGPPRISQTFIESQALSNPKDRHDSFYRKNGRPRGRKFYYHQGPDDVVHGLTNNPRDARGRGNDKIYIVPAGESFSFQVDFADLMPAELGLLLYSLRLEEDLFHKFGKGKPLGFGSVKITVESVALLPADRYERWEAHLTPISALTPERILPRDRRGQVAGHTAAATQGGADAWQNLTAEQKIDTFIGAMFESFFMSQFGKRYEERLELTHIRDLRQILSRHDDYEIRYPSKPWFVAHPNTPLPTTDEVEGNPPGDRSKWLEE